jgi:hypothetical protein
VVATKLVVVVYNEKRRRSGEEKRKKEAMNVCMTHCVVLFHYCGYYFDGMCM